MHPNGAFGFLKKARCAITKAQAGLVILVILVALVAGVYLFVSSSGSVNSTSVELRVGIVETDPVNQLDSLIPSNITASRGYTVTLAVQNGDDEPRQFLFSTFNINATIGPGTTNRFTFMADKAGTFDFHSYATIVLYGKVSPRLTGYLTVTP